MPPKCLNAGETQEFNADQEYLTKNLPYFTAIFFYAGVLRDFVGDWRLSCAGRADIQE